MSRTKIAALLVLAGIAVTGGSAFTDSIASVPATTYIGSSTTTVDGSTASSIAYTYNAGKTAVTSIAVSLADDTHGDHLWAIPTGGGSSTPVDCGAGVYGTTTDYTCDTSGAAADWPTAGLTSVRFTLTT